MKIAVIETGGKQYLVKPEDKLKIETLAGKPGENVIFDKVLVIADEDEVKVGKPYVFGAAITGKIVKQGRSDKVLVMKYHSKTRYRRKKGHRQMFTEVEIETF